MPSKKHELIIIGGGPAGLTAGIYTSRARIPTLIIERMGCGGQAAITDNIENYPGFAEGINGFELSSRMESQARAFGTTIVNDDISGLEKGEDNGWIVRAADKQYESRAVIIAAGARYRALGVPGEEEFTGRGVSYCATCDGAFYRGREVVVVGGGDSAIQEALFLTRFASRVTIIHRRDMLRASAILQERIKENKKISLLLNSVVTGVSGTEKVSGVTIRNTVTGEQGTYPADGVFVFIGWLPNTGFTSSLIEKDAQGYIVTDDRMATNIEGIFACGDVRRKLLRQVVTAAGDGATAAIAVQEYLENLKGK